MIIELINTGSELMAGRVLNTHQQWLCRQLADLGYVVSRQVSVADVGRDIEQAVRESLAHADLVITTGGLGPTSDDLTRDLIAELLGKTLREDPAVLAHIRHFFEIRNRPMPGQTAVQALVPEGAVVLHNAHGTAPGLAMRVDPNAFRTEGEPSWLLMLPGPPRELRPMFTEIVVPLLRREMPLESPFLCRTLRTTGLGESLVQEKLHEALTELVAAGLEVGYCARPGEVDVRLATHKGGGGTLIKQAEEIVRRRLGSRLFGAEDDDLASVILRELTQRKETLAVAESCTGGYIANQLTNVPGASAAFVSGMITYSNEAKQKLLGVKSATLDEHGAVSEPVARQMAEGARKVMQTNYALSVTGIAGPGGGTAAKPVGTVFVALAGDFETIVETHFNPYDRETFKHVTAQQALNLLRRTMSR